MRRVYRVLWQEGSSPTSTGTLELLPRGLLLNGRGHSCEIPYSAVSAVRVDRGGDEQAVVIERLGGSPVTIAGVSRPLLGELAEQVIAARLDEPSFLATPGPGDSDGGDVY
jgi:hypothetical protein